MINQRNGAFCVTYCSGWVLCNVPATLYTHSAQVLTRQGHIVLGTQWLICALILQIVLYTNQHVTNSSIYQSACVSCSNPSVTINPQYKLQRRYIEVLVWFVGIFIGWVLRYQFNKTAPYTDSRVYRVLCSYPSVTIDLYQYQLAAERVHQNIYNFSISLLA